MSICELQRSDVFFYGMSDDLHMLNLYLTCRLPDAAAVRST